MDARSQAILSHATGVIIPERHVGMWSRLRAAAVRTGPRPGVPVGGNHERNVSTKRRSGQTTGRARRLWRCGTRWGGLLNGRQAWWTIMRFQGSGVAAT